jgi:hypothetical protein
MKKHWIEYHSSWQHSPMTFWVYRADDDSKWHEAKKFTPPAPPPFREKGFPMFCVEVDGVPFRFASLRELRVCIEVLSRKVLPTTAQLIRESGLTGFSNHVWLGRLPKKTHSMRYRAKAIPFLEKALSAFEKEVPNQAASD